MRRAVIAAIISAGLLSPAFAKKVDPGTPENFSAKNIAPMKLLKKAPGIVVPGYRVWFTVQDAASAVSGGGLGAKASLSVALRGVDEPVMQEIADQAFADFMEQLKKTGRPVIGPDEVQAHEQWQEVKPIENPQYDGARKGKGVGYMIYSPQSVPLWVHYLDQFGGANPFNQKSVKAMYRIAAEKDAVVLIPNIVVRFAMVSSSGRSNYARRAEVGVKPWLAIQMTSSILQLHAKNAKLAGAGGWSSALTTGIKVDEAGQIVQPEKEERGDMDIGFGKHWKSVKAAYVYEADPVKYKAEVLRGIQAFNRAVAQAVEQTKP